LHRPFPLAAGLFFAGYLAIQTLFPLACLTADSGCLFAWTMYAGRETRWEVYARRPSGEETLVPRGMERLGSWVLLGKKVDEPRFTPPYLCREYADAEGFRFVDRRMGKEVFRPCER
jgi:hypothetical protein